MSMVFKFRMLSDENDYFLREYEVLFDMTLADLHRFICHDLHYDAEQMATFHTSNTEWNKLREFTLMDMGEMFDDEASDDTPQPETMDSVILGQLIRKNHDRLIWTFDLFGGRACYLELVKASQADSSVNYPRTVMSEGEAADQLAAMSGGGMSIFDEAMSDFDAFEGDDNYDDEY